MTTAFPLPGSLGDNGNPARTHALLAGSPGIGTGQQPNCTNAPGAPLTRDQRCFTRPACGATSRRCDLGAVERLALWYVPFVMR